MKLNVSTKSNIMASMVEHLISTGEPIKIFNCDFDVESHETYRDVTGTVISCDFVLSYDVTKDIKESPSSDKPENKHNNCRDDPVLEFLGTGRAEHICLEPRVIPEGKVLRCYIEDIEQDEKPMNKQELIDKAVEDLKGMTAISENKFALIETRGNTTLVMYEGDNYIWAHPESAAAQGKTDAIAIGEYSHLVQRARDLGWINGYKWGVEYPTNGKKPDLPDDTQVTVCKNVAQQASEVYWLMTTNFKIIDQRYKPVDVEQVQVDWFDYDKQQAIGLPPVGVECEVSVLKQDFRTFEIRGFYQGKVWLASAETGDIAEMSSNCAFRPLDYNRKADEEKRAFVEAASKIMHESQCGVINDISLGKLYDAGCRFK